MKKMSAFERMARSDGMAELLTSLGYLPSHVGEETVTARGSDFHVYVDYRSDEMYFGIASEFDRWANSRDYLFEGIPNDDDLTLVIQLARRKLSEGVRRGDDFEPVTLNSVVAPA